MIVTESSNGV